MPTEMIPNTCGQATTTRSLRPSTVLSHVPVLTYHSVPEKTERNRSKIASLLASLSGTYYYRTLILI